MELRGRKRQKVEPPEETARDFFPELLDGERLNRCKEECGACLFDISCEDGTASEDPAAEEVIGILDSCIHAFHASCIQKWAELDSSCPQCKSRFSHIGLYSLEGARQRVKYQVEVFLADTLTDNEDDDTDEILYDDDVERRAPRGRTRARAARRNDAARPARRRRGAPRGGAERSREEELRVLTGRGDEVERRQEEMRRQLRRDIEMARRRRNCCQLTEEKAKKSIERWFSILPYQQGRDTNTGRGEEMAASEPGTAKSRGIKALDEICHAVQKKTDETIVSLDTKPPPVIVPFNAPKTSESSFGEFEMKPANYAADFLLKSNKPPTTTINTSKK